MDQGKCYLCESTVSDKSMVRHIKKCIAERYGKTPADVGIPEQSTYLVKVQDKYQKEYYLYLLVDSCVLLSELDRYLRDIWLECCGHFSSFRIDGEEYVSRPGLGWDQEDEMDIEIGTALAWVSTAAYTYDFGSSTELTLRVIDTYDALEKDKGIRLAGRNILDKYSSNSSEPVNSPRAGVCGYEGPADDILFMKHEKSRKQSKNNKPDNKKVSIESDNPSFVDEVISGKLSENTKAELDELVSRVLRVEYPASSSLPPYIIDGRKLKAGNLPELLGLLRKNELDYIRKSHGIEKTSNIKKDALVKEVNALLNDSIEEILFYMPTLEYITLLELAESEDVLCDSSEEIPEHILTLRKMGMIYSVQYEKGRIKWLVPEEVKFAVRRFSSDKDFLVKRELTERIESTIVCIFFYWGIVTRFDLLKEASKLLDIPMADDFQMYFGKVFGYMRNSYIDREIVGSMEIYHMFSEDPQQQVISKSWQNSKYPEIPGETLNPEEGGGWVEYALQNPYFSRIYSMLTMIDDDEQDEEIDPQEQIEFLSILVHYVFNARPGMTVDKMMGDLGLDDELSQSGQFRSLLEDMLVHSHNYWLKGNAVSGELHLNTVIKSGNIDKEPRENGQKATERAAERWKVGRNDPCPCGSGKKYKKCCM